MLTCKQVSGSNALGKTTFNKRAVLLFWKVLVSIPKLKLSLGNLFLLKTSLTWTNWQSFQTWNVSGTLFPLLVLIFGLSHPSRSPLNWLSWLLEPSLVLALASGFCFWRHCYGCTICASGAAKKLNFIAQTLTRCGKNFLSKLPWKLCVTSLQLWLLIAIYRQAGTWLFRCMSKTSLICPIAEKFLNYLMVVKLHFNGLYTVKKKNKSKI